jgi:membrane carboxypeptidase/penicillin-binding protein
MKRALYIAVFIISLIFLYIIAYYAVIVIKARNYTKNEIAKNTITSSHRLDMTDLSQRQINILLAVEDPGFYNHNGIDLSTPGAGITTITQGLVKKLYFKQFKPGIAKIRQTLIAVCALDSIIPKNDQLSLFINIMYLGNVDGEHAVGFGKAAQLYYGKPFQSLTEDEYISLVAVVIAPKTFHIKNHPDWNAERVARIKALIAGEYKPRGLMDLYYGALPPEVINSGLPPFSYFKRYHRD